MNLIMMGTGDFTVPIFQLLLDRGYPVRLLVTQPDRPKGRHQEVELALVKRRAIEHNIPVFQPESVNTADSIARLAEVEPDLLVVAAYGQILRKQLLEVSRLGGVNLHASLLPKYRGAAPVNWAIYHGEQVTGVTVIQMSPKMDAGAILLTAETPIDPEETAGELEDRLARLGAPLVCEAIDGLAAGTLVGRPQDKAQATRAPKLNKEHGLIDWSRDAQAVCNQIRSMQPWPMPFTFWHSLTSGVQERLIIERCRTVEAEVLPGHAVDGPAGSIVAVGEKCCVVKAGRGFVSIERLRPAGKRTMSCAEFLRGHAVRPADRLGPEQLRDGS